MSVKTNIHVQNDFLIANLSVLILFSANDKKQKQSDSIQDKSESEKRKFTTKNGLHGQKGTASQTKSETGLSNSNPSFFSSH